MNQKLRNAFKSLKNQPMMHMARLTNPLKPLEKTDDDVDAATAIDCYRLSLIGFSRKPIRQNSNKKSKALPLSNELRVAQTIVSSTHV